MDSPTLPLSESRVRRQAEIMGPTPDELISHASLPLSVIEWILLDDSTALDQTLR